MPKFLICVGPALGHVARALSVALRLRTSSEVSITFSIPEHSNYRSLVSDHGFEVVPVATDTTVRPDYETYPAGIEHLLADRPFDAVVADANPLAWDAVIDWPEIPRTLITNAFLAAPSRYHTLQQDHFEELGDRINTIRHGKGLPPMESPFDIYRTTLLFVADLEPIRSRFDLPANAVGSGPCVWDMVGTLPDELSERDALLLISMGSTGPAHLDPALIERLVSVSGAGDAVYAGSKPSAFAELPSIAFAASMLPLGPLIAKARLVVTQGGTGSTYQALARGVPVAILPRHRNHRILGDLVESLGVGFCLDVDDEARALEPARMDDLRDAAESLATKMALEDGPGNVVEHLLRLV